MNQTFTIQKIQSAFLLDNLSILTFIMVAIIGTVVIRFSKNYLDGEKSKTKFLQNLVLTLSSISLFLISGDLIILWIAWVSTSLFLHQLLIHYPDRPKAQAAAKNKYILARIGDGLLLIAFYMLNEEFHTTNIKEILASLEITTKYSIRLEISGLLLVLAAIVKSAQIPFQGWLLDVMEAPTPVSALLHAGLINAGPFLIIRFSPLIENGNYSSILILVWAGISATLATIIFTTQSKLKTGLAYSSIAHMGFSLFLTGMGFYSAALLHIISHSFYKAYSFLSSGNTIAKAKAFNSNEWSRSMDKLITKFSTISFGLIIQRILILILIFLGLEYGIKYILNTKIESILPLICLYAALISFYFLKIILLKNNFLLNNQWIYRFGIHVRNGFYFSQIFRNIFKIN